MREMLNELFYGKTTGISESVKPEDEEKSHYYAILWDEIKGHIPSCRHGFIQDLIFAVIDSHEKSGYHMGIRLAIRLASLSLNPFPSLSVREVEKEIENLRRQNSILKEDGDSGKNQSTGN